MSTRTSARRVIRGTYARGRRLGRTLGRRARVAGLTRVRPAVLMYHRVGSAHVDPWGLTVSPERFDEQLSWLSQHRVVLPLAEFARLQATSQLPPHALAVTFDDGYACNALTANPLLVAHGVPATVFVTTAPVAAAEEYWWDDLQRMVFDAPVERLEVAIGDEHLSVDLGAPCPDAGWASGSGPANDRQRAYLTLWRTIRSLEADAQRDALAGLRRQARTPIEPRDTHRPMTVEEVAALDASVLVDVGCHTSTHPVLPERAPVVQRAEIEGGRDASAAIIGRVPTTFAYPFGDYDTSTVELVRAAGFEAACTTDVASVGRRTDVLMLPRLQVEDWSAERLARELRAL